MKKNVKIILRYPYYFFVYYLLNYFIQLIPCWFIRKSYMQLMGMKLGKKSVINMNQLIIAPDKIAIGKYSHINSGCIIDGRGGINIGSSVSISFKSNIITGSHDKNSYNFSYHTKPVKIEDYVWIGINSTILPGITIGKGAVIAGGSVVTKDVPEMAIVAGVPAKQVGFRRVIGELNYKCIWTTPFA